MLSVQSVVGEVLSVVCDLKQSRGPERSRSIVPYCRPWAGSGWLNFNFRTSTSLTMMMSISVCRVWDKVTKCILCNLVASPRDRNVVSQVGYRQGNPRLQTQIIGRHSHFNTVSSHFGLRGHGSGWPWNNLVGRRSHVRFPMHAPLTMSIDAAE